MDTLPLVTIKCTAYNHEPYIRQCLEGFVMQKTNFCFEAIVHDDASTDKTADVIREYAEKYPDIIKPIYQKENQYSKHDGSIVRAMHAATSKSSKYIALCEGDDYWTDPLKLQKQVDFLEQHPEYYVVGMRSLIYKQVVGKYDIYENSLHFRTSFDVADYVKNLLMHTSTFLIRKECVEYEKNPQDVLQGDISFILHSSFKGRTKIKVFKSFGSVYRKHEKGISSSSNNKSIKNSYDSMCTILDSFDGYSEYRFHRVVVNKKRKMKLLMIMRTAPMQEKLFTLLSNILFLFRICCEALLRRLTVYCLHSHLLLFSETVKKYVK